MVKGSIVVTIDRLDILKLREVTKRVSITHEILDLAMRLQAFDDVNDVLDLVAMKHTSEELIEGIRALTDQVLHLSHKLFLHVHAKKLHVESIVALTLEDCTSVVSLFHDNLKLSHIVVTLQTTVDILLKESLTKGTALGFSHSVVHVGEQHLANSSLPHVFCEIVR